MGSGISKKSTNRELLLSNIFSSRGIQSILFQYIQAGQFTCDFCKSCHDHVKKYHYPCNKETGEWGFILYYCKDNQLCRDWFSWENSNGIFTKRPSIEPQLAPNRRQI